jgi:hypothetical protein
MSIELFYYTDNYNKNYLCFPLEVPINCIDLRDFLNHNNEIELNYRKVKYIFYKKNNNMSITTIKNNINISQINFILDDRNIYYFNDFSVNLFNYCINSMMNGLNM